MQIKISEKARQHIAKKIAFYGKKNRVPRIVIAERSCSGAVFRLHFEALRDCDIELQTDGITIYGSKDLLDEIWGVRAGSRAILLCLQAPDSPYTPDFSL